MREVFDPWLFITASYVLGLGGTVLLVAASWIAMRRAEARRDRSRDR